MKANESVLDRVIRVLVGIALLVLYFTHVVTGGIGIVSIIVGAILLLTGATGFCPLYSILKLRTTKK